MRSKACHENRISPIVRRRGRNFLDPPLPYCVPPLHYSVPPLPYYAPRYFIALPPLPYRVPRYFVAHPPLLRTLCSALRETLEYFLVISNTGRIQKKTVK